MGIGAAAAVAEALYKYGKRKYREAQMAEREGAPHAKASEQGPPTRVFEMPAGTPYVIVRRDGAVWAGPWKNDGRSFTRVPKNWWTFQTKEKAEAELESNDFLAGCTIEEAE